MHRYRHHVKKNQLWIHFICGPRGIQNLNARCRMLKEA